MVCVLRARLSLLVLALLALVPGVVHSQPRYTRPHINGVLGTAQLRLAHQAPTRVVRWLRRQPVVASAWPMGGGVEIHFRGGIQADLLPRDHLSPLPAARLRLAPRPESRVRALPPLGAGRRALLLFPFGQDMNLLAHADALQAQLQAAGFTVDRLDGADVTVPSMATISHYDLVYMVTHSSSNQYGEAVIATGQVADSNHVIPAFVPLINEGSVIITGVAGTTTRYYGIRTRFVRDHLDGQFPAHSLLFFNGCNLTQGTYLWRFLAERGAATMVAWDNDVVTLDYAPTGTAFFDLMLQGDTVAQSIATMEARGQGISYWAGNRATLQYVGDGTLTLDGRSSATPTPAPRPTATPLPTATATSTPLPTATPVPTRALPLAFLVHLRRVVRAGARQTIAVTAAPGAVIHFVLRLPGRAVRHALRHAGLRGQAHWRFRQLPTPRGHQPVAVVTVRYGALSITRTYRVLRAHGHTG